MKLLPSVLCVRGQQVAFLACLKNRMVFFFNFYFFFDHAASTPAIVLQAEMHGGAIQSEQQLHTSHKSSAMWLWEFEEIHATYGLH